SITIVDTRWGAQVPSAITRRVTVTRAGGPWRSLLASLALGPMDDWRELFGLSADAPHVRQALTHPSYANEQGGGADNQRLEFLGDAVLGFCASELLYARF